MDQESEAMTTSTPTPEQRARWLEITRSFAKHSYRHPAYQLSYDEAVALCAAVAQEAIAAEREHSREICIDLISHLAAAHSLLSRSSKKAAASDKMFDQMLTDYQASINRGRDYLKGQTP